MSEWHQFDLAEDGTWNERGVYQVNYEPRSWDTLIKTDEVELYVWNEGIEEGFCVLVFRVKEKE